MTTTLQSLLRARAKLYATQKSPYGRRMAYRLRGAARAFELKEKESK